MRRWFANVTVLGMKELRSLASDAILLAFVAYAFSFMIYSEATGVETEVRNASVAVVDGDRSVLSRRITDAILPPQFKRAVEIDRSAVDPEMDRGRFTFVLDIPPHFEADVLRGRRPSLQLNIDATAISQAGVGAGYIEQIVLRETASVLQARGIEAQLPVTAVVRAFFNPNLESIRFQSVMALIEVITMISMLLVGAAVIREREHGTIEHLLVMPLTASEIAAAKIWANGLAVLAATAASLMLVIRLVLQVPIEGSIPLFLFGTAVYLFATTSIAILLATVANTMPQFGLLGMITFMLLNLLSGAMSPLESMPDWLQWGLQASPTVHFVKLTHGVLYRNAGLDVVWPQLLALAALGAAFLGLALSQFRAMLARQA